jgi:hypothetical protein
MVLGQKYFQTMSSSVQGFIYIAIVVTYPKCCESRLDQADNRDSYMEFIPYISSNQYVDRLV